MSCQERAVVEIDAQGLDGYAGLWLCREHARAHAREVLSIVHKVEGLPAKPLPASQRGFGG